MTENFDNELDVSFSHIDPLKDESTPRRTTGGRRKIPIEYIQDKSRRTITFSKRKAGIMKKAFELSTLTGTQVLLLVASETGHVYTFATPKLQPLITKPDGKNLIQTCLNAPDTTSQQVTLVMPQQVSQSQLQQVYGHSTYVESGLHPYSQDIQQNSAYEIPNYSNIYH